VADHWQGRQGLAWSFFINLVLLRALVFAAQDGLVQWLGDDFSGHRTPVLVLAVFFHGVVFVWQAVGVLRAAESTLRARGSMAPVWGVQGATAAAFFLSLSYLFGAWQLTLVRPDPAKIQAEVEANRAAKYTIDPAPDGQSLLLVGTLELGITRQLKTRLDEYPDIRQIVLTSTGGNIYEARGLSEVIRQNGLSTLVRSECSSACTTVFIGGADRRLLPGARLGFHQYRIDADYAVLGADPADEQRRDRALFLKAGVANWFVDKMYDREASEMWFPERAELREANVVTGPSGNADRR